MIIMTVKAKNNAIISSDYKPISEILEQIYFPDFFKCNILQITLNKKERKQINGH